MEDEFVKATSTNHERVYENIKAAITEGLIPGGSRITEVALAKRFNVSRTPVREALVRLSAEHLVRFGTAGGAYVPAVTRDDVTDVYRVRAALEGLAANLACSSRPTEKDLLPLIHQVELAELSLADGDLTEVERHNSVFHKTLVELAGNPFLRRQLSLVQPFTYFLRRQVIDVAAASPGASELYSAHLQTNMFGHREIVRLLSSGDGEKAQEYLVEHISEASASMVAILG